MTARARAVATRSETHRSQIKPVEDEDRELVEMSINLKGEDSSVIISGNNY